MRATLPVAALAAAALAGQRAGRAMTIRVLIADDQAMVRSGLRHILEAQPGITVVGEAADGAEAVALGRELRPGRLPG